MKDIVKIAKKEIPSVEKIIEDTWRQLKLNRAYVRNNFGEALFTFDKEATRIFKRYEKKSLKKLATLWLSGQKVEVKNKFREILAQEGWNKFIEKASQIFVEFGILVQELEKDLGNMRKARGGMTFQKAVLRLLQLIDVKCEIPKKSEGEELGRIDIVIPSTEVAKNTPDKAIFLTCKRTLRERWKQEVPQARLNQRIYLITIDDNLSENKAEEINQKGLIAFVRDELITEKGLFKEMPWIRKLSDLPKEVRRR